MDTQPITQDEILQATRAISFCEFTMRNLPAAIERIPKSERHGRYPCCQFAVLSDSWFFSMCHYAGRSHTAWRFGLTPQRLDVIEKVLGVIKALES